MSGNKPISLRMHISGPLSGLQLSRRPANPSAIVR